MSLMEMNVASHKRPQPAGRSYQHPLYVQIGVTRFDLTSSRR